MMRNVRCRLLWPIVIIRLIRYRSIDRNGNDERDDRHDQRSDEESQSYLHDGGCTCAWTIFRAGTATSLPLYQIGMLHQTLA